jgi:hypothetical protein
MDDLILGYLLIGIVFAFAICYFYFSTYRWVALKRKFTNRNYGIIRFRTHGRNEFPIVVDFDKDSLNFFGGIYIIEKGKIYRQLGEEKQYKGEIDVKKAVFSQGCPVIHFDLNDMYSLDLTHEKMPPSIPRNPQQMESTLRKIRAGLEADTVHSKLQEFKKVINLQYVTLIIALAAVGLSVYLLMQVNQIGGMTATLGATLDAVKALMVK